MAKTGLALPSVDAGSNTFFVAADSNHGVRGDGRDGGNGWTHRVHGSVHQTACGYASRQKWLNAGADSYFSEQLADLRRVGRGKHSGHFDMFAAYAAVALHHLDVGKGVYGDIAVRRRTLSVGVLEKKQLHRVVQELTLRGTSIKGRWSRHDACWRPSHIGGLLRDQIPSTVVLTLGRVTAGWGSAISRPFGGCPLVKLTEFFWREYSCLDGCVRGYPLKGGGRCSMHLKDVSEFRSSQTHSSCFSPHPLKQQKKFATKHCVQGAIDADSQLAAQAHVGRCVVLDRDENAVRCIGAKARVQEFGDGEDDWLVHPGQKQRLDLCMNRAVHRAWRRQQQQAARLAAAAAAQAAAAAAAAQAAP